MSVNQYFRAGAGSVIYTTDGQILLFERSDLPGVWQLQQGGMDPNESPETTLWRELYEETGLTRSDATLTHTYPNWLSYTYPPHLRSRLRDPNTLGQIHQWYFLALNPDTVVDLSQASDREFRSHTFASFVDLTAKNTHDHSQLKRAVYLTLADYFEREVRPTLTLS